ncbi:MAG: SDR family oxidoreductase [Candidatus Sungbacteria bacterium]|nr:SDR family oxidoreductase [Candidatus Sungbacteria bacterium]
MFELKNKVAFITGARRGMGRTHALALARQGARVVITDIDAKECLRVVKEVRSKGGRAACFEMDVSNKTAVDQVFDRVIKQFGRLDILVNNAGIYSPKSALKLTEADWDRTVDINLKGQFLCAQRAAKEMAKRKWGRIINISSIASGGVGIGFEGAVHYAASKGGIIGMTESMAVEFARFGITVNAIAPGAIDTPMVRASGKKLGKEMLKEILERVPLKRIGRPEEISALVVFLASSEASYVTGATFYADGGWLAQ